MLAIDNPKVEYPEVHLHVGADRLKAGSGGIYNHINPATGEIDAQIPHAGVAEVNAAVEAAHEAFQAWRRWQPTARRDALMRLANLLEEDSQRIGRYATMDTGLPIAITSQHGTVAKNWIAYYAGLADKIDGDVTSSFLHGGDFGYVHREPFGVIGLIITWNGPVANLCMKAGPALAAGNTIVVKPSEQCPFSTEAFMDCVREAGIPAGVINIVHGGPVAGEALVSHPKVRKISFTGGPVGARRILASCAQQIKPAVLELGGKSANIIFEDADLDAATQFAALFSVGICSGQGCCLPTRLLVQDTVYDEVVERVAEVIRNIKIGDPWDPETLMGPIVSEAALQRIIATVEEARDNAGGKVVLGGSRMEGDLAKGFYMAPTVFRDVSNDSALCQEEIFGPVLAIMKFSTEEEAIKLANATEYGLAAFIQSRDLERVHRMAAELEAGGVYINGGNFVDPGSPFGGQGLSGYGREGGRYGLEEFLQPKAVRIGSLAGKAQVGFV